MKFKELKKSLIGGAAFVYLIEGEDAFFRERAVLLIENAYLSQKDLNYSAFNGADIKGNISAFLSAVTSYPFMSEKRIVLVRDWNPSAAELKDKDLLAYFNNPEPSTIVIVINSDKSDAVKKLPNITVVDCAKGDSSLIMMWINGEAKKNGVTISESAANKLIEYCLSDMTKINGEMQKLVSYCKDRGAIESSDVEEIVTKDTEFQVYELAEKIARGNIDGAYSVLFELLGKNNDPQRLFISMYSHFRRLFFCSVTKASNDEIAACLGVKEFAVRKAKEQAAKFSPKRLKKINDYFAEADAEFKSGDISVNNALWNSVFSIIAG